MRSHLARLQLLIPLLLLATPRPAAGCFPVKALEPPLAPPPAPPAPFAPDWTAVTATGQVVVPPSRVYDRESRRLLLTGGSGSDYNKAVWAMPLEGPSVWSVLVPSNPSLSPRRSLSAIYDPGRHRVIVFGGY